jgi:hypothetical protein
MSKRRKPLKYSKFWKLCKPKSKIYYKIRQAPGRVLVDRPTKFATKFGPKIREINQVINKHLALILLQKHHF